MFGVNAKDFGQATVPCRSSSLTRVSLFASLRLHTLIDVQRAYICIHRCSFVLPRIQPKSAEVFVQCLDIAGEALLPFPASSSPPDSDRSSPCFTAILMKLKNKRAARGGGGKKADCLCPATNGTWSQEVEQKQEQQPENVTDPQLDRHSIRSPVPGIRRWRSEPSPSDTEAARRTSGT